eukprot:CAMPEP_0119151338 /NCGR_PEP_ID=MMETSP1310-20130426/46182_1 /TAXON_ID=464262 /ORGANISM="Genus nov. species nov., Strain RCC2339" /LENGTH=238 /DNA_ID=CAMNT_0007143605 /DNA_START=183 /DNA_END=896 /DNA_ORIENTATION=-
MSTPPREEGEEERQRDDPIVSESLGQEFHTHEEDDSDLLNLPGFTFFVAASEQWRGLAHNQRAGALLGVMLAVLGLAVVGLNYSPLEADPTSPNLPLIIGTWGFVEATNVAWEVLMSDGTPIDALEAGINYCEQNPENPDSASHSYGGAPNEDGEVTLDAVIIDGKTGRSGAVGNLKKVSRAVSVARKVLEDTNHRLLAGEDATRFAYGRGFPLEDISTETSQQLWEAWVKGGYEPNY